MPFNAIPLILGAASATGAFLNRREADDAAEDATAFITNAEQGAANRLNAFFQDAGGEVRAATGAAAGRIGGAFGDEATAAGLATGERIAGLREAEAALERGVEDFRGAEAEGLGAAQFFIDPELASARAAQAELDAATGALGVEAQQEFFDRFQDDPGFNALLDARRRAVISSAADLGLRQSGRAVEAVADTGEQSRLDAITRRLDRLRQTAAGAGGLATSSANLASGSGQRIANALLDRGTNLGNLAARRGTERGLGLTQPAALRREGVEATNALTLRGLSAGLGLEGQGVQAQTQGQRRIGNALARRRLTEAENQQDFINSLNRSFGSTAGSGFGFGRNALTFGGGGAAPSGGGIESSAFAF